ncbi:MAG: RNA polymerase sigma factor [Clostridiales bacterium]|jgi:RNA polymerase sigma-70 factor (ECF subfamily)|uniref:RNA polymerase sigma factor n=1 Tax=Lacrimispora sp. TaxID=2719234 RepID=UPI0028A7E7A2|nr:RNA polymerase sigma factor [Lacrimispora sp.]MBS5957459.1 RNA polymerase sigma factor [Clostridiales bacterium]
MKQKMEDEAERMLIDNYDKYYRLAYSYVKNEQDALDIVQESAYRVIRDLDKLKERKYLSTWIYRIVINTAIDTLRKKKRETVSYEDIEIVHEDQYKEEDPLEILNVLEDKDRALVILKYLEDWKLEEISEALDMNISTVKSRLYRALKKLKGILEPEVV